MRSICTGLILAVLLFVVAPAASWGAPPAAAAPVATATAKVNLNAATAAELEELPGIGAATAKKIIENRPYAKVEELSKAGLSAAKIEKIEPLIVLAGPPAPATPKPVLAPPDADIVRVNLNTASSNELEKLPGVGAATATKIIANRPYTKTEDLSKAGLTPAKIAAVESLVTIGRGRRSPTTRAAGPAGGRTDTGTVTDKVSPDVKAVAKINLNTATDKELEELPGVGPATAKKIVAARPYSTVAELSKAGLTEKQIAKFESQVSAGAPPKGVTERKVTKDTTPVSGKDAPAKGDVWVNTESGIYHKEGDRWYGKTKVGKYMSEDDAKKAGYREGK